MTFWSCVITLCQRHLVVHPMSRHITPANAVLTVTRSIYQSLVLSYQVRIASSIWKVRQPAINVLFSWPLGMPSKLASKSSASLTIGSHQVHVRIPPEPFKTILMLLSEPLLSVSCAL